MRVLSESRWLDTTWMKLVPSEGYPNLGQFGLRVGPDYHAFGFYHDLAHALVAVQDNQPWRLFFRSFYLQYTTKVEVFGNIYEQPVTDQGVQNELRVIALQYHLTRMDTVSDPVLEPESDEDFFKNHVGPLKYMEDLLNTKVRFRKEGKTGGLREYSDEEEKFVIQQLTEQCRQMAEAIQPEDVVALWEKTCAEGRALSEKVERNGWEAVMDEIEPLLAA